MFFVILISIKKYFSKLSHLKIRSSKILRSYSGKLLFVSPPQSNCSSFISLNGVFNHSATLGLIAEQNPGNTWAQFKTYLKAAARLCVNNTNEKWIEKLAAVDVFR